MYIEGLGNVKLIPNIRAKKVIIRFRDDQFQVTHPLRMQQADIEELLLNQGDKLLHLRDKSTSNFIFDEDSKFITHTFNLSITKTHLQRKISTLNNGVLKISIPSFCDIYSSDIQMYIKSVIESCCRVEAKRVFPSKVKDLAKENGFEVSEIKINKSRSRWGSCSIDKNINLSYFCMMLPNHLIDLVILHELCHTIEMNHGDLFWALLDKVTNGKSKVLTRQLKEFRLPW